MKELGHKERFRIMETDKGTEKRTLKGADSIFQRYWNKFFPPPTYKSLKHGETKIEKRD